MIGRVFVTEGVMAKPLVDDELWAAVSPLLPRRDPEPRVGKPPTDDRVCLAGILFVLKTGIGWEDFPCAMGCSGMTLLNRLRAWQRAGVWAAMHRLMLGKLRATGLLDLSRAVVDSGSVRAARRGEKRGRAPSTAGSTGRSTTS